MILLCKLIIYFLWKKNSSLKRKNIMIKSREKMKKMWYLQKKKSSESITSSKLRIQVGLFRKKVWPAPKLWKAFTFLFNLKKLKLTNDDELMISCVNLEVFLKHGNRSDLDGNELFTELNLLIGSLPTNIQKVAGILDFLKKVDTCYSNTWTSYRIVMTVHVSVASAERKFSKLKHKILSWSSMSREIKWFEDHVDWKEDG